MKTKLRFMALVLLGIMLSVNQVWGDVITINCADFGTTYSNSEVTFTKNTSYTMGYGNIIQNNTSNPSNWYQKQLMQCKKNATQYARLYNKTSLPGLSKIRFYVVSGITFQVYTGTSMIDNTPSSGAKTLGSKAGTLTGVQYTTYVSKKQGTGTINIDYYDIDITNGDTYFYFTTGDIVTAYIYRIEVTYGSTKTAVSFEQPTGGTLSIKNGSADVKSGDEFDKNTELTVTATPGSGYTGGTIKVVKTATPSDDVTSSVMNGNTLTVPDYNITVSASFEVSCSKSITITKGTPSNGSFELSKTGEVCINDGTTSVDVTDISPNGHYHFKQITATNGSVDNNNKQVTDISANTTINVEFAEDTKYTVEWYVAGAAYSVGTPSASVYENEKVTTIPTAPADNAAGNCATKFMGWSTSNLGSAKGQSAPTDLFTTQAGSPTVTSSMVQDNKIKFYAVFASEEE